MTLEAAVEALARAMPSASWCVDEDGDPEPQFDMESGELLFWPMSSWSNHVRDAGAAHVYVWGPPPLAEHVLTPREAMLVLRCALLGTTRVRCPDCATRGGPMEWCQRYLMTGIYTSSTWMWPDGTTSTTNAPSDAQRDAASAEEHLRSEGWETSRVSTDIGAVALHASRPCPACTGPAVECPGPGEYYGTPVTCESGWLQPHVVIGYGRSCPTCNPGNTGLAKGTIPGAPTGHVDRPWAEVLLGAMPRECPYCEGLGGGFEEVEDSPFEDDMGAEWDCLECGGGENRRGSGKAPGDPEARPLLTVKADELQAKGDPLGLWLALYLGQQPCERCGPGGVCTSCSFSGLALGAHDRAMAEAGERMAVGLEQAEAAE